MKNKNTINIALIGLGKQGYQHLSALNQLMNKDKRIVLVGICDSDVKKKILFTNKYNFYENAEDLLNNNHVDMAIVSVPNNEYINIIPLLIKNKIHILKEKPLALNMNEARKYCLMAKHYNVNFQIAQQRKYDQLFIETKKWIRSIGLIQFFDYRFTINDGKYSWYWVNKYGGGSWVNVGWHICYLLNWYFGKPLGISLNLINRNTNDWDSNVDDLFSMNIAYKDFFGRAFGCVTHNSKSEELTILGSKGSINLTRDGACLLDNKKSIIRQTKTSTPNTDIYEKQIKNFISNSSRKKTYPFESISIDTMEMICKGIEISNYKNFYKNI